MKKILSLLAILGLLFSFGCSGGETPETPEGGGDAKPAEGGEAKPAEGGEAKPAEGASK